MFTININILNAQGFSNISLKLEIIKKSLIVVSIVACFSFGIKAMLAGFVVANYIAYATSMVSIKKSLGHYYRHQLKDILSNLIVSGIVGIIVLPIHMLNIHVIFKLILMGLSYVSLYALIIRFFFPLTWNETLEIFRKETTIQ
jgi:hypothetical protein